ncbi:MAG: hypothetical protein V3S02_00125 [Dehalococcoidales bacterium]
MNKTRLKGLFSKKKVILLLTGTLAGALILTGCGVSQETVDAKDQEIADLRAQLTTVEQDAKYWTQLSTVFMQVDLPSMTDHKVVMTPGGMMVALHFDNHDISKA